MEFILSREGVHDLFIEYYTLCIMERRVCKEDTGEEKT